MQELLERVREVVAAHKPRGREGELRTVRALSPALDACRQYVKDNAATDKGCAQRLARELDSILAGLPTFQHLVNPKEANARHTRRLAEEHLDEIQTYIQKLITEEEDRKKEKIREWVKSHPVFGQLRRVARGKCLPKDAYVLLYEEWADGLHLLTRASNDTIVLTRFRPREFTDDLHVYKMFHSKKNVVGAAVVSQRELLAAIGNLPAASENRSQVDIILSQSKKAASEPAIDFVSNHEIFKDLHRLARKRSIPKDAYILLFRFGQDGFSIVTRAAEDGGKVLTRFWPNDFALEYKIFEEFRQGERVVGAVVIKDRQVLHAFGVLPADDTTDGAPVNAILRCSSRAVEQPSLDFIAANEVLTSLHELAGSEQAPRDSFVVLFVEGAARLEPFAGARGCRFDLNDFRSTKLIFDRFNKSARIVGASVIGEPSGRPSPKPAPDQPAERGKEKRPGGDKRGGDKRSGRPSPMDRPKPAVIAAFGRTPLKMHLLATPENLRRLGLEI
jgi:hypothetical protein